MALGKRTPNSLHSFQLNLFFIWLNLYLYCGCFISQRANFICTYAAAYETKNQRLDFKFCWKRAHNMSGTSAAKHTVRKLSSRDQCTLLSAFFFLKIDFMVKRMHANDLVFEMHTQCIFAQRFSILILFPWHFFSLVSCYICTSQASTSQRVWRDFFSLFYYLRIRWQFFAVDLLFDFVVDPL